jgi:hypothetical protein
VIRKVGAVTEGYRLPTSAEITRVRPLRRLAEPWLERRHVYGRYAAFLDRLTDARFEVVPLRELRGRAADDRVLVGLRHDVDDRLASALELARLEHARSLRATYFVLHGARYYDGPELLPALRELQELGHEVGFHYDLVTLQVVRGVDPRAYLEQELARLRGAGIDVVGVAAHGSYWGHRLGYKNDYFFRGLDEPQAGFPNAERVGEVELAKGTLEEFGLAYDASRLGETDYWTDSWVDASGRRWHPELLDLRSLKPGARAIVLVHPCHWDRSATRKAARTVVRLGRRTVSGRPR